MRDSSGFAGGLSTCAEGLPSTMAQFSPIAASLASADVVRPGREGGPASETGSEAWFAIWTRSRHEARVRDQLAEKGIDAFLPTVARWSRWKDRKKRIDWPLFPGYCFARFDPAESLPVLKCAGVVTLVSFQGRAARIPDHEIEGVRALVRTELQYDPCPLIREGQMVEVLGGPLRGVIGRLVRKGSHARLV